MPPASDSDPTKVSPRGGEGAVPIPPSGRRGSGCLDRPLPRQQHRLPVALRILGHQCHHRRTGAAAEVEDQSARGDELEEAVESDSLMQSLRTIGVEAGGIASVDVLGRGGKVPEVVSVRHHHNNSAASRRTGAPPPGGVSVTAIR